MASGLGLKSMKQGKKNLNGPSTGKYTPDPYSYNHRVSLDSDDLTKLGVKAPNVGDVFDVMAHAHVISTSANEHQNGEKAHRVELQLKKMGMKKQGKKGSMLDAVSKGVDSAPTQSEDS